MAFCGIAKAQIGSLDLSFDSDGKVTTDIETKHDVAKSIAIQSDGKIVVAGFSENSTDRDFSVVRYNTNGSLDNTFDSDGKVTTAVGSSSDEGYAVAIQSDGKIIVAGFTYGSTWDLALVRYNTNGSLDNTFDSDGIVTTAGSNNAITAIKSIAIQSDGKILAAGTDGSNYYVYRYNNNGSLDNTFDNDGKVITSFGTGTHYGNSMVIQSNGKIVVGGTFGDSNFADFALVRYNSDGSLDNTFDLDGKVTTSVSSADERCYSIAIQSDGKIVAVGYSNTNSSNKDFAIVRFNSDGSLDNTFDLDGMLTQNVGGTKDYAYSVLIQNDGKIIVAGYANRPIGSYEDFAIIRLNSDGSTDTSFDGDGKVTTSFFTKSQINAIAIQNDGKIVAAGYTENSYYEFAVARYNNLTIGFQEPLLDKTLSFFPNPTSGKFTVSIDAIISKIEIYNLLGENIYQSTVSGSKAEIDLGYQTKGVYFIKVYSGQTILTKKIVIE